MARTRPAAPLPDPRVRAQATIARLGVLPDEPARLRRFVDRVELFLWKFLRMRWHDIHQFFEAIENKEAMEFGREPFSPGRTFAFFAERQTEHEWENTLTVGISLVFAAMRQAADRGFNPKTAGIFTLQRMLEQAVDEIGDLEELLTRGAPP